MKHTPGPWKYTHRGWSREDANRSHGYQVYHPTPDTAPEMPQEWVAPHVWREGDAQLICAAHDLLDACETVLICVDLSQNPSTEKVLQKAIASARQ